jgi:hypothetical protein
MHSSGWFQIFCTCSTTRENFPASGASPLPPRLAPFAAWMLKYLRSFSAVAANSLLQAAAAIDAEQLQPVVDGVRGLASVYSIRACAAPSSSPIDSMISASCKVGSTSTLCSTGAARRWLGPAGGGQGLQGFAFSRATVSGSASSSEKSNNHGLVCVEWRARFGFRRHRRKCRGFRRCFAGARRGNHGDRRRPCGGFWRGRGKRRCSYRCRRRLHYEGRRRRLQFRCRGGRLLRRRWGQ